MAEAHILAWPLTTPCGVGDRLAIKDPSDFPIRTTSFSRIEAVHHLFFDLIIQYLLIVNT